MSMYGCKDCEYLEIRNDYDINTRRSLLVSKCCALSWIGREISRVAGRSIESRQKLELKIRYKDSPQWCPLNINPGKVDMYQRNPELKHGVNYKNCDVANDPPKLSDVNDETFACMNVSAAISALIGASEHISNCSKCKKLISEFDLQIKKEANHD